MRIPRSFALFSLLTPFATAQELRHDDGTMDDKRSMAGAAQVVRFERPDEDYALTSVRVHGSRYGRGYDPFYTVCRVSVRDEQWKLVTETCVPYEAWEVGTANWVEAPIGPARVPERFFVVLECFPERTRGIYVSIDGSAKGDSFVGSHGERGNALDEGTWMIRVDGSSKRLKTEQPQPDTTETLARGEGEMLAKLSTAGMGHATLFQAPSGKKLLTQIEVFGSRYGADFDPRTTFFHVFVCDRKLEPLARSIHPYSSFAIGEPAWVTIDVPDVEVPSTFAILCYFDPTQTRGIYLGRWAEARAASLHALPGKIDRKVDDREGWMLRATIAKGKRAELPPWEAASEEKKEDGEEEWDAIAIAEALERIDAAERAEDLERVRHLAAELRLKGGDGVDVPTFDATPHFFMRRLGMPEEAARSLLAVLEAGHQVLTEEMGFERVGANGKKVHLHVTVEEEARTSLFTNPRSEGYSQIVLRGPLRSLHAPDRGGPHVVYGFLHELGHVLIGWEDSEHQWAHWLGSHLASRVHAKLGEDVWFQSYDVHAVEGLPRFEREVRDAKPGLGDPARVGRLFQVVAEQLGVEAYAPAFAWIAANREGRPFQAVRLYRMADLRDALIALGHDAARVRSWFGNAP